jgi:hypothetical protein
MSVPVSKYRVSRNRERRPQWVTNLCEPLFVIHVPEEVVALMANFRAEIFLAQLNP